MTLSSRNTLFRLPEIPMLQSEWTLKYICRTLALISATIVLLILVFLVRESAPALLELGFTRFFTDNSGHPLSGQHNLVPMIMSTCLSSLGAIVISTLLGIASSLFMHFYARPAWAVWHRRQVGMIFQKPNPFAMSIRRNIELALREHGVRQQDQLQKVTETVLREVGLWDEVSDRLHQSALELSGGQQQRLCIARALALRPQVLLMDEPCSALDPIAAGRVEHLIQSMRNKYTIIIVTHNLAQARRLADHMAVFWMRDGVGELIEHGETARLFTASTNNITNAYLSGLRG